MSDIEKLKTLAEAFINAGEHWGLRDKAQRDFEATISPAAVLELIAENERLQRFETAYKEFSDKTDWVQESAHWSELGMHRADVLRKRCNDLTSHNQAQADEISRLRAVLTECADSLHGEMLQKFGGQLPDDMHPVTRREYERDLAEVAGYRTLIIGEQKA